MERKSKEEINITEFTVYSDLAIQDGSTRLQECGVKHHKVYKEKPDKCKDCGNDNIVCMSVLGAGEDPLFWMCDSCETLYLTIDKLKTEALLEMCSQYWTNPNDWGAPEGELN
tara:strand:+ start:643 stop:981 length:339 start_codon:yes stop_codon:yes gene_type:complete